MEIIKKVGLALSDPIKLFKNVAAEKGVKNALFYYMLLAAGYCVLNFIVLLLLSKAVYSPIALMFGTTVATLLLVLAVVGYFLGIVLMFVIAGIYHLFAMMFGTKKKYIETYKAAVYGATPSYLFGWVPYVGLIALIWTVVLQIFGIKELHKLSGGKAAAVVLIPVGIAVILAFIFLMIYAAYLMSTGNLSAL